LIGRARGVVPLIVGGQLDQRLQIHVYEFHLPRQVVVAHAFAAITVSASIAHLTVVAAVRILVVAVPIRAAVPADHSEPRVGRRLDLRLEGQITLLGIFVLLFQGR
jgi:hypothetical protein